MEIRAEERCETAPVRGMLGIRVGPVWAALTLCRITGMVLQGLWDTGVDALVTVTPTALGQVRPGRRKRVPQPHEGRGPEGLGIGALIPWGSGVLGCVCRRAAGCWLLLL